MYRSIETSLWTDPKVKGLPTEGKFFFLYLITNPHAHVSGIYVLEEYQIVHDTGLTSKRIDTLWDTLYHTPSGPLVMRDRTLEIVWVVNMLRYQGRGALIVKGVNTHLKGLHHSLLIAPYVEKYSYMGVVFDDTISDTLSEGYDIPTVPVPASEAVPGHPEKASRSPKITCAENVCMFAEEREKLVSEFGETAVTDMIEILDNYKGANGKKYKSDYRAILSWVVKRWREEQRGDGHATNPLSPNYDHFPVG
jgi:hypothetical protein